MKKFLRAFIYASNGIIKAMGERNVRIQTGCAVAVIAAGFYFHITLSEWITLLIMISLVLSLELINTAIENLVDLVSPERKPLAGKIKDISAGAVLIAAVFSVIVGILIFARYLA